MTPPRRTSRARTLVLLGAATAVLLAGCGRIPTSGPVYHYEDGAQQTASANPSYSPSGPADGASPDQILRGFLDAGTGIQDDYAVARSYLTQDLASSWTPEAKTSVYEGDISVSSGDGQGTAQLRVATQIDDRGIATSYSQTDGQSLRVQFKKVDGQWRISRAPDGTVLTRDQFEKLFRPFNLYFYDPTFAYAVPDVRWLVNRPTVATSLVRTLLKGPAPYLEGAVVSAVPSGTTLEHQSVPVTGNRADVELSGQNIDSAGPLALERVHTQLMQSLSGLQAVQEVGLAVEDKKVDTGQVSGYRAAVVDPAVGEQQIGTTDGKLVYYANGQSRPVTDFGTTTGRPQLPGISEDRSVIGWLDASRQHLTVRSRTGEASAADLDGAGTAPSADPRGWVWTGTSRGSVKAIEGGRDESEPVTVTANWLKDQDIASLRVSRDGSRVLVVTGQGSGARLWISGVVRGNDGKPERLTQPVRVATKIQPSEALWIGDTSLVVADTTGDAAEIVSLDGRIEGLNGLSGLQGISAGRGRDSVFAQTDANTFRLSGNSWSRVDTAVRDLAYAG